MQRGRQPCVQVALGTGQQTRTEALVGRGSSRPRGWRREGWEGFLGLVGAQLLLFVFLEPPHLPLHPPSNFLGLVNFSTLSRSSLFLKVSMRHHLSPCSPSFFPFIPSSLPCFLLYSLPLYCGPGFLFPFLPLRISVVRLLLLCFCEPTDCSTPGFPGV